MFYSWRRFVPLALFPVLLLVVGGCQQPPKPMQFNNMIAKTNQKLSEASKKFYKALEPLKSGAPADASAAQNAYTEITTALRDARTTYDSLSAPFGSTTGPELLANYRSFLTVQQTILDSCISPMNKILQDNANYPDAGAKWVAIAPLIAKASEEESSVMATLRETQKKYCKEHVLDPK
ncbi:MAG: hypothetical protein U0840_06355 [Gemmataceae bacterium]